ncbi:MAG: hypothetical protein FJ272_17640, partial [Planctomycetes bacterium]|nr:hypothetical protein [Planctomycetota bacterium]
RAWCGFLCDVMGVEASPSVHKDHRHYAFFRTIAHHKPFLLLYSYAWPKKEFPREAAEEYIQSAIAYGLAPGYHIIEATHFAPRDADLFDKFMPAFLQIARAGWEPVTHARASDRRVWLERFGQSPGASGKGLFFTLYNPTADTLSVTAEPDRDALRIPADAPVREVVSGSAAGLKLSLPPKTLKVLQIGDAPPPPTRPQVSQEEIVEKIVSSREKTNADSGGLLKNGGFEQVSEQGRAADWAFQTSGSAAPSATTATARTGRQSLHVRDVDEKGHADATQTFAFVQPGWRYTLSLWVKQAPGSAHTGRLYFQWRKDAEKLQQGRFAFPRAADWTRCQWTLEPPPGATALHIALGCSIPETAELYVDDVSLRRARGGE